VKVGRSALDEIAIRSIEESNPDVEFDWTSILKEGAPEATGPTPRPANQDRRNPRRPTEPRALRVPAVPSAPPRQQVDPVVAPQVRTSPVPAEDTPLAPPESAMPAIISTLVPTLVPGEESAADQATLTPAHARLGVEGVLRLRARHAEILARISERVTDAARQDELKAQAERLNPDTWVTVDEVRVGLEGYESELASLRAVVGQGRRRRRRAGQPRATAPGNRETPGQAVPGRAAEPEHQGSVEARQDDDPEPEEEPV